MKTFVRESYREIVDRLNRDAPDQADRALLDCIKSLGPETYETLLNRGGALAAAIQRSNDDASRREYLEEVGSDCEQLVLQNAVMAHGVNEIELFQRLTFRLTTATRESR